MLSAAINGTRLVVSYKELCVLHPGTLGVSSTSTMYRKSFLRGVYSSCDLRAFLIINWTTQAWQIQLCPLDTVITQNGAFMFITDQENAWIVIQRSRSVVLRQSPCIKDPLEARSSRTSSDSERSHIVLAVSLALTSPPHELRRGHTEGPPDNYST